MKKILLFFALCLSVQMAFAASHVLIDDTISQSKIYPGTVHTMQVYVPSQYTADKPACLYVGLDGVLCNAPAVMDSLIAAGKMPVTIGVFLQPGRITGADGTVLRYNRSNEFDATTATFASFLEQEVLPRVEQLKDANGTPLHISKRGEDHMIFGLSSGGIAAFIAAWHRPDLFSRVFSGVGTFVSMRGGNDVQMFVRKCEPRSIKVFLQDGSNDAWNPLFGHWYEGNKMLASALDFAGYTAKYDWSDGGHNVKRSSAIFAEVMTWMWEGWPGDVQVGQTKNDLLQPLLVAGSKWEKDPALDLNATSWGNMVYYPDMSLAAKVVEGSNCLNQVIVDDGVNRYEQPFYWLDSYDNSALKIGPMAFDADGNLWVTTNAGIQICDQNGRVRGIIDLPAGTVALELKALKIQDGSVTLVDKDHNAYHRAFNVKAPIQGSRPKSQGQG